MTRHRTHKADSEPPGTEPPAQDSAATATNGADTSSAAGATHDGAATVAADERMRRAEEMVDQMAQRVGDLAGRLGHGLLWLAARAREEAEDIWAEARSISRGQQR